MRKPNFRQMRKVTFTATLIILYFIFLLQFGLLPTSRPYHLWLLYGAIGFYILLVVVDLLWTVMQKLIDLLKPVDDLLWTAIRKFIDFLNT